VSFGAKFYTERRWLHPNTAQGFAPRPHRSRKCMRHSKRMQITR
jgi:hypothetical protein